MRLFRLVLVLLLSLALPVHGIAGLAAAEPPCPMAALHDEAQALDEAAAADCCDESAAQAGVGDTCKTGQECKSGSAWQAPAVPRATLPLARDALPTALGIARLPSPPASIWRPPAFL